MADVLAGWAVVGLSDPDVERATAVLIEVGEDQVRILNTRTQILHPTSGARAAYSRMVWHAPSEEVDLAEMLREATPCDSVEEVLAATSGLAASGLDPNSMLSAQATQRRQAEAVGAGDERKLFERTEPVPFSRSTGASIQALLEIVRREKETVSVVVYVNSTDESQKRVVKRWLSAENSRRWIPSKKGQVVKGSDQVRLAFSDDNVTQANRDHWIKWLKTEFECNTHVIDSKSREGRYYLGSGFADVVMCSGTHSIRELPRDVWTSRCNAVVVPARTEYATEVMRRIADFSGAAVFVSDRRSRSLWQAFSSKPDISALVVCLTKLAQQLEDESRSTDDVRAELLKFLATVYEDRTLCSYDNELATQFGNPTLRGYKLPLPGDEL